MALREQDSNLTRQYLLGQLNETEELALEERLFTEDDLYEELQLTKDELAQEYAGGQLTLKERDWLQKHLFASPEGNRSRQFAESFNRYAKTYQEPDPEPVGFWQRLDALWTRQTMLARSMAAVAVVLIAYFGFRALDPLPRQQTSASLTLENTVSTRSTEGGAVPTLKFKEDALKLTLVLPQPSSPGTTYRFELIGEGNVVKTLETSSSDPESILVVIPAKDLPRGQYVATLSRLENGTPQRIPGGYHFKIE